MQTVEVCQAELPDCSEGRRQVGRKKGRGKSRKGQDHRADEQDCWVQCDNTECAKWRRIPKSHMKYANPGETIHMAILWIGPAAS